MPKKEIIYYLALLIIPTIVLFDCIVDFNVLNSKLLVVGLIILSIFLSVFSIIFKHKKKEILSKLCLLINIILSLIITLWVVFSKYEILTVFSSISSFKNFILSTKEKGMIIYVLIQFLQVLFVPIPSMIITLTGVAIYGPIVGSILCTIGVLLGSYCSFFMGKILGFKIACWITGKQNATKYAQIINERGKFFLIIAFLLPLFPDDILCLIAGITTMKFKHFFWIALITRPIGVICMSFFGGGYIIPFTGWGLFVWPFILIFAIVAVIVLTKYQPQVEEWILVKILKLKKKKAV